MLVTKVKTIFISMFGSFALASPFPLYGLRVNFTYFASFSKPLKTNSNHYFAKARKI